MLLYFPMKVNTIKKRTVGNFANVSVAWKNMLYLSGSIRNDIVSSMPRNNRSFTYPSVSLGFIFTELAPLKNNILTFGKIRASYAEVGMAGDYTQSYYYTPAYGGGFYGESYCIPNSRSNGLCTIL